MYIELRGLVINKSLSNLGIDSEDEEREVRMTVDTSTIECFREVIDDDGEVVEDETIIYLKGNGSYVIKHNYDEIKKILNDSKTI